MLETLRREYQLTAGQRIADIGSGTGLLTELFLQNGNVVFAVEPNREMRLAGESGLGHYPGFVSVAGRAEATLLPQQSVDFVVAGQAFHWFDRQLARQEFGRILRPAGWVMLVWNERETEATPFLAAYEQLLQTYATDYAQVDHRQVDEAVLTEFYAPAGFRLWTFRQRQVFDYAGVQGRLLSSSYTPEPGQPNYEPLLAGLATIFAMYAVDGRIEFPYTTQMYIGQCGW